MENKPAQNIQDSFLNTARKDKSVITIYLLSGVKLSGRIRSFDKYSVVLDTNNQEQLIFKHAISTVVMSRAPHPYERHAEAKPAAEAQPGDLTYSSPWWNRYQIERPLPQSYRRRGRACLPGRGGIFLSKSRSRRPPIQAGSHGIRPQGYRFVVPFRIAG